MKSFVSNARRQAGFTLVEISVVLVLIAALVAAALPAVSKAITRGQARNTIRVLGQVKSAKDQYRAEVAAGSVTMPTGSDADTIGNYTPTLADIAPYIKLNGVQEGATPTATQVMAGTGQRVLVMNDLDTDPVSTPLVPAEYQIK